MNGINWQEFFLNASGEREGGSEGQEQMYFELIARQIAEVVNHYTIDNNGKPARANHAKMLAGFTGARFRVLPAHDFPEDLIAGFLHPGAEYPATLRFSNANGAITDNDATPDLRGVALRIFSPDGNTDLLMTNAEIHHARDAREAMITIQAGVEKDIIANKIPDHFPLEDEIAGMFGALPFLVKHLGFKTALHIAGTLKKQMKMKVQGLSTETFWSRAPIAVGKSISPQTAVAIKYRLWPAIDKPAQEMIVACTDLRKEMENELSNRDIIYYLEVQRFIDEQQTPIEDATKSWGGEETFQRIAEIIIPRNSINEMEKVNALSFSPWNVDLRYFRPLGSMNRSRKMVYAASVLARNK